MGYVILLWHSLSLPYNYFETLRREIKADIRKQRKVYVNNLVGDVMANPRDFYCYINSQKWYPHLKKRNGSGVAQSEFKKQVKLMVSSRTCSLKLNIARSLFWIDQPNSWRTSLILRKVLQNSLKA